MKTGKVVVLVGAGDCEGPGTRIGVGNDEISDCGIEGWGLRVGAAVMTGVTGEGTAVTVADAVLVGRP